MASPLAAKAQSRTFALDRLYMAGAPEDGIGLWRPQMGERTRFFGQFGLGYALNPFRVENHVNDPNAAGLMAQKVGNPVTSQLTAYLNAGVEMFDRFGVQVALPIVAFQDGHSTTSAEAGVSDAVDLASVAVSDLRLDGRVILFRNDPRTFKLAGSISTWFPTGNELSFAGDRTTTAALGLAAEYDLRKVFFVLNTGVHLRPIARINDFTVSNEWTFGAGAFVPMRDDTMRLGVSFFGSTGMSDDTTFTADNTPLEWLAEGRFAIDPKKKFYWGLGGGTRLSAGYAPDLRATFVLGSSFGIEDTTPKSPTLRLRSEEAFARSLDTDRDGLADDVDLCPAEPEDGKPPYTEDGCPAPPDRDSDGITDASDKCPDAAEDMDRIDDADGCPEDDADGDKILDALDACPKEPGEPSTTPAQNGCPQFIRRVTGSTEIQILQQIQFETGKARILPASFPILDEVVKLLKANAEITHLGIEGHTDNRGPNALNERLSGERAQSVMDYLIKHGIEPSRLTARGYGPQRPIADNDTVEGRQKNRRVEFHIQNRSPGEPAPAR